MNEILQADIFFFITTISVVIVTILLVVALLYAIRLLRNLRDSSEIIKNTVIDVSRNVAGTQNYLKTFFEKLNVVQLISSAFSNKRKKNKN